MLDLTPARWIWYPSQRTLANTFTLFRRVINVSEGLRQAIGWIAADSRYRLTINGVYVQWGPAPSDPRWPEADPLDLSRYLEPGENVIGVEVLYYGHGDGTWVMGKPGLLFRLDLDCGDGSRETVVSDLSWNCFLDRAHRPGQYKRWYLRSLQEEFDARIHPYGWDTCNFVMNSHWLPAMELSCSAAKPSLCSDYTDYLFDSGVTNSEAPSLRERQIPLLRQIPTSAKKMSQSGRVVWHRNPDDWFDFRTPDSFEAVHKNVAEAEDEGWRLPEIKGEGEGFVLTFQFEEQIVGWPYFTIDAPEGTIVELIVQESHDPDKTLWLDTHKYTWSRLICREGVNSFQTFDFESLRWMQLHVRGNSRPVVVSSVGVLRRMYNWPNQVDIRCSDPVLQRLFEACVNTIHNGAQETVVDGMGRERQQYSGDIGHELHGIRYTFGEYQLPARFLSTYSHGLTLEGYFIDCWPAYDRMVRIPQRQVGLTKWGPILDHSVQFVFDCWNHYLETGDIEALNEPYERLLRFGEYLRELRGQDGLLAVENLGVPTVWIDHDAYRHQRHKQCAFNLYSAAMFSQALAPLCWAFGDKALAEKYKSVGDDIRAACVRHFWSEAQGLFVANLPWVQEEGGIRLCDRSLATAILFGFCPSEQTAPSITALVECPPNMGISYPPNAGWRYQALARSGRVDVVLGELRNRWASMNSVVYNNTMQEGWDAAPDTSDQWSHASVAPLNLLFMDMVGLRPLEPGFSRCQLRPQLGDLEWLRVTAHTPKGPIHFAAKLVEGGHRIEVSLPAGCEAELPSDARIDGNLPSLGESFKGVAGYRLESGRKHTFFLPLSGRNS